MKTLYIILTSALFVFAVQTATFAQSINVTEIFKEHFNETVLAVHNTEIKDEKRAILDDSFNKMIIGVEQIESLSYLTEDERANLATYKNGITEKLSELNGLDGFDEVIDEDLNDFSDYSQNYIEQANRTITIGVTTALLILIVLLLI